MRLSVSRPFRLDGIVSPMTKKDHHASLPTRIRPLSSAVRVSILFLRPEASPLYV